ncbi:MAG: recombinase family protein, partial [Bacteriovoracaceae bacterium]|nr:recombinase family protein [Bacteriovoracaceae bacterium]
MREKSKKMSANERKALMAKAVHECEVLAQEYLDNWKPVNKKWDTIEGAAYLRVSDSEQVLVDKGSLLQQININVDEAKERSHTEHVNYKIVNFFIEPGISGRHDKRPAFQRMNWEIKQGIHDFIIIKELSRLVRDAGIWKDFFNRCNDVECEIVIRGLPFNPNNPQQVLQLDQMAMNAEYESKQIGKRTKETNHSALIYSGKLNSTHLVLGLDQLIKDGVEVVGKYTPNKKELRTVEWIMNTFVKYGSYMDTLRECECRKIFNKNGESFTTSSLKTVLTNKKYIGRWEVNFKNKQKKQKRLMPYERYEVIDLPHGCVIDLKLWEQVERVVEKVGNGKNSDYIHLLSGLLKLEEDGSSFHGVHVKAKNKTYYRNELNKVTLISGDIDGQARAILQEVIDKTSNFKDSLKKTMNQNEQKKDLMEFEKIKLDQEVKELEKERVQLDKRMDFLLSDDDMEEAKIFRTEYKTQTKSIREKIDKVHKARDLMGKSKEIFQKTALDLKGLMERIQRVMDLIEEGDRPALKNAYKKVFSRVLVGKKGVNGVSKLRFVLRSNDFEDYLGYSGNRAQECVAAGSPSVGDKAKNNDLESVSSDGVVGGNKSLDRGKMGWLMGL